MSQPFFPPLHNQSQEPEGIPLGQRLLRAGLITQAQLAQGLREQHKSRLKFGEVCLEHQWLSAEDVYQFTPAYSLSLGEILVAKGFIAFDQLRIALAQQQRYGRKLGEILIWKGWIRPEDLEAALKEQRHLRERKSMNAWQALQGVFLDQPNWLDPAENSLLPDFDLAQDPTPPDDLPSEIPMDNSCEGNVWAEIVLPDGSVLSYNPQELNREFSHPDSVLDFATNVNSGSGYSEQYYQQKLASLELQLELQQREWDQQANAINQQISVFQTRYQQRIALLEGELLRQKQDNQKLTQHCGRLTLERDTLLAEIQSLKAELQQWAVVASEPIF